MLPVLSLKKEKVMKNNKATELLKTRIFYQTPSYANEASTRRWLIAVHGHILSGCRYVEAQYVSCWFSCCKAELSTSEGACVPVVLEHKRHLILSVQIKESGSESDSG